MTVGLEPLYSETHRDARVSVINHTTYSQIQPEETHQLAEKRRRAYIRGLVIPGENHRIWTLDVAPEHVPFLERHHMRWWLVPVNADGCQDGHGQKDGALTSILRLRSLKMEEIIVSSSISRTSSLDGQMSRRYTSFPSEVTPAPHNSITINKNPELLNVDYKSNRSRFGSALSLPRGSSSKLMATVPARA